MKHPDKAVGSTTQSPEINVQFIKHFEHSFFIIYFLKVSEIVSAVKVSGWVLRTCICLSLATVQVSVSFAKISTLSLMCSDQYVKYGRSHRFPSTSNLLLNYHAM